MAEPTLFRKLERIVLAGFMGSGKSTVGRLLAQHLNWSFADLDEAVEHREGKTVPELFAQQGEAAFRLAEAEALQDLLRDRCLVLALGGGAPETAALRHGLATTEHIAVVHLHAPFEVLYARCLHQAQDPTATVRPLLAERAAAEARFARRLAHYRNIAHVTIDVTSEDPQRVAGRIASELVAQFE